MIGGVEKGLAGVAAIPARVASPDVRWCILNTSGPKTLALVSALKTAGFDVWTPTRTIRRPIPGQRRRLVMGVRRCMMEVAVPILSGFVFARSDRKHDLLRLSGLREGTNCPRFTVLLSGGDAPLISEASVSGLREAEAAAEAEIQALRDADTREAERKARAEMMRTESQRIAALRSEVKRFAKGERVIVASSPSFAGMVGTIAEDSEGRTARVSFEGSLAVTVGAWQVFPAMLGERHP